MALSFAIPVLMLMKDSLHFSGAKAMPSPATHRHAK